jgi:hypothetical protein
MMTNKSGHSEKGRKTRATPGLVFLTIAMQEKQSLTTQGLGAGAKNCSRELQ